jgi:predicted DNA binding CopG/RHH family protein
MKYFELEKEEKDILEDFERGEWNVIKSSAEKLRYKEYISSALQKTKNINIRLSEDDLLRLRAKALHEGIPYQTYIASLVHKHVHKTEN